MEMQDEDIDNEIITNICLAILRDAEGMNQLINSAANTPDPAKGAAQFLMMLFDAVSALLEQTGIPFDFGVITANGGVVDNLVEEVTQILSEADVEVGPDFEKSLVSAFLEMVKAAAMAEEQGASPSGVPSAPAAAPSAGSPSAGMGGLLDPVTLGGPR